MLFASGIDYTGDLLDLGEEHQVLEKSGSWLSYKGEKFGNGRERCREFLKEHPEIAIKVENEIRIKLGLEPRVTKTAAKPAVAPAAPTKAPEKHEEKDKDEKKAVAGKK